jgi:hypothetical protein
VLDRGQRRGARDEQACPPERRGHRWLRLGGLRQPAVHRRHAEEHRGVALQRGRDGFGGEPAEVVRRPGTAQRPDHADHEAVDVEERQRVGDDVALRPLPGVGQGVQVRRDGPARQHGSLRRPGGARRVDDERRRLRGRFGRELEVARVTSRSTASRGRPARASGRTASVAPSTHAGVLSPTRWVSSRVPDLGLMGMAGTPASRAPTTPTQVSARASAHTATRPAPASSRASPVAQRRSAA